MDYATTIKKKLLNLIDEMNSSRHQFTRNPHTDFSREKKWSFAKIFKFMISMEGKSLKDELYEYFDYGYETPSNSSFNQRRALKFYQRLLNFYFENLLTLSNKRI